MTQSLKNTFISLTLVGILTNIGWIVQTISVQTFPLIVLSTKGIILPLKMCGVYHAITILSDG